MNFTTSWDRMCIFITIGTTLLFGYVISMKIVPMYESAPVTSLLTGASLIIIYLYCFLQRPVGYTLNHDKLVVNRPVVDWSIEYSRIKSIRIFSADERKYTIRTLGVGGLFGYFGWFANSKIGRFRMFGTRRDRTVLIETTEGKKIIITPDQPEELISSLRSFGVLGISPSMNLS